MFSGQYLLCQNTFKDLAMPIGLLQIRISSVQNVSKVKESKGLQR